MARGGRGRSGGGGSRRRFHWDGLQIGSTGVAQAGAALVLVDGKTVEDRPGTVTRIVGDITLGNWGTAAEAAKVVYYCKILMVELNDAGSMSGDHAGLDTHEEDIGARQLWTAAGLLPESATDVGENEGYVNLHIDVKGQQRMPPGGKHALVLLIDADGDNRLVIAAYVRVLMRY